MTDRYFALTVLLEEDTRTDDAGAIIDAIRMIKGVAEVEPHVSDMTSWAAEARARREFGQKLWRVLYPQQGKE